ncbi:ATP-dependent nuclease [Mucilaginibacter ginkgonis]|uniref:AAA family ATPase n=1 Tax=Mucilaginibacter ginkgonis TaxID=2682091 RepID=A0A6I4IND8_9SPHI|nr:AAA family ATPase [Mucilaginibacter ginkgonis]QQL49728.1 AAA family ATPase [Mucilaginibacter ginkgonis]
MKLISVQILNYRSIKDLTITIDELTDKSYTYGLLGVNEAGKSTLLKALAYNSGLKNEKGELLPLKKDFRDRSKSIQIIFSYRLSKSEVKIAKEKHLSSVTSFTSEDSYLEDVKLIIRHDYNDRDTLYNYDIDFFRLNASSEVKESIEAALTDFVFEKAHDTVFWTPDERFLISKPINLSQFAADPNAVSVPLQNCFALAGMKSPLEIQERIALISESTEREQLKDNLSDAVSAHINAIWKKHPIKITFDISDGQINFHVRDLNSKAIAKTADQRSDGFAQFVSFLLTISAENKTQNLNSTILLIDEPETHLHPRAQIDLLDELITITKNMRNNIVFFATHSNYMADKKDMSRNYKVSKVHDDKDGKEVTVIEKFDEKITTYAGATYKVFDIPSSDYHNELYSRLHEAFQERNLEDESRINLKNFDTEFFIKHLALAKNKPWKGKANSCSLPTFVRNGIHHPTSTNVYTDEELRTSIEIMEAAL